MFAARKIHDLALPVFELRTDSSGLCRRDGRDVRASLLRGGLGGRYGNWLRALVQAWSLGALRHCLQIDRLGRWRLGKFAAGQNKANGERSNH
ncbi:MAG: hypothetical protein ACI9WU_001244 [Myxococcota bacterium]|jgi:hypothetical protein